MISIYMPRFCWHAQPSSPRRVHQWWSRAPYTNPRIRAPSAVARSSKARDRCRSSSGFLPAEEGFNRRIVIQPILVAHRRWMCSAINYILNMAKSIEPDEYPTREIDYDDE